MATVGSPAGLEVFDTVTRGDAAPRWVHEGIVRAWGIPAESDVSLIVLSENITFSVSLAADPTMVVRLGRPGYAQSVDHPRAELQWVEALRETAGIPTPAPIRGTDGDLVQFIHDERGGRWTAVAFEFVAGTVLEDEGADASRFAEIGRLTALLHDHARSWVPPTAFIRFEWDIDDMVGPDARWGDWRAASLKRAEVRTLERAESKARATLDTLGIRRDTEHFGLIHGDLRPSNVMVMPDGENPLTIIDFDDCGFGYYLYDFAAAITFYEHRPAARDMAAGWLDGYRAVNPLTSDDLRAAESFVMLRRLTMLGWATTHRSDALPPDLWDENLPGTVEVASRYLDDPGWITRD